MEEIKGLTEVLEILDKQSEQIPDIIKYEELIKKFEKKCKSFYTFIQEFFLEENVSFAHSNNELSIDELVAINVQEFKVRFNSYSLITKVFDDNFNIKPNVLTNGYGNRKLDIIIKFPEKTVTSEAGGMKHHMKDIYLHIGINDAFKIMGSIRLFRGTLTIAEHSSGYHFSHAYSGNGDVKGQQCCLGTGTTLSILHTTLVNQSYNFDTLELFFSHLPSYLEYESISGAPYIRIASIKLPAQSPTASVSSAELAKISNTICFNEKLPIDCSNGKYDLSLSLPLRKIISRYCPQQILVRYNVVLDKEEGVAINDFTNYLNAANSNRLKFFYKFKGAYLYQTVISENNQIESPDVELLCNTAFCDAILNNLKRHIYEYQFCIFHTYPRSIEDTTCYEL